MSNATDFPGGKLTNNIYSTFGYYGHLTIYRNFNSDNAGREHPLTPQPGDVLQREDNTTPLHRPIAVNTNVHRGSDGIVRMIILRTTKGTFRRPTTKMCPLSLVNSEL
jgi:hypothetical protein